MGSTSKHGLRYPESTVLANTLHTRIKDLADDTDLQLNYYNGTFQRYTNLCEFNDGNANLAGYIVIQTNLTYTNVMTKLAVQGYTYDPKNNLIDLEFTFYPYALDGNVYGYDYVNSGSWHPGSAGIYNRNSDGKVAIVIGADSQAGYLFQYPKFVVHGMFSLNSVPLANLQSGWSVSRISAATLASSYTSKRDLGAKYGAGDDTGWIALPTQNNWSSYGVDYPARYRRDAGWVTVEGLVAKSIAATTSDTVATLPSGFRPEKNVIFNCATPTTPFGAYVYANASGTIVIGNGASATWTSMSGIRFKAHQ